MVGTATAQVDALAAQGQERLGEAEKAAEIALARVDLGAFCRYVLRDARTGGPLNWTTQHDYMCRFIEYCLREHRYCAILAYVGSGKSTIGGVGFPLWFMGQSAHLQEPQPWWLDPKGNQLARIQIISGREDVPKQRAGYMRRLIEAGPGDGELNALHHVFPHLRPDHRNWGRSSFTIQRRSASDTPTVDTASVKGGGEGPRCDVSIRDDTVTRDNAITRNDRATVIWAIKMTWDQRVDPGGFRLHLNTVWHELDYVAQMLDDARKGLRLWSVLVIGMNPDYQSLYAEALNAPGFEISNEPFPLWDRLDLKDIDEARKDPLVAMRCLELKLPGAMGETFPWRAACDAGLAEPPPPPGMTQAQHLRDQCKSTIITLDPGGEQAPNSAFTGMGRLDDGRYALFCQEFMARNVLGVAEGFVDLFRRWNVSALGVETNGLQKAYKEVLLSRGEIAANVRVVAMPTGTNKIDPGTGLDAYRYIMGQGGIVLPARDFARHDKATCNCVWCELIRQFQNYPRKPDHGVMSSWMGWLWLRTHGGTPVATRSGGSAGRDRGRETYGRSPSDSDFRHYADRLQGGFR